MMLSVFILVVVTLVFGLLFSKCLFMCLESGGGAERETPKQALCSIPQTVRRPEAKSRVRGLGPLGGSVGSASDSRCRLRS